MRLLDLGRQLDAYTGVEQPDREFNESVGKTDSERLYDWLAEATNEARFA